LITFTPSTLDDCDTLAPKMRLVDVEEVKASSGVTPLEALVMSKRFTKNTQTISVDNEVVGMCGIASLGPVGSPWLLGSDGLRANAKHLLPLSKEWLNTHGSNYQLMYNYVSAENRSSIRWLKYLGFNLIRFIPKHGVGEQPFYEFVRIKEDV